MTLKSFLLSATTITKLQGELLSGGSKYMGGKKIAIFDRNR